MGGAKAILATVTDGKAMQAIAGGLGPNGVLMVIGAVGPLTVNSLDLLAKRASVKGWYSGIARDSEDTLNFSLRNKVASMNEIYPLEKAAGRLPADDERQGPLPRRPQDGRLTRRYAISEETPVALVLRSSLVRRFLTDRPAPDAISSDKAR